VDQATGLGTYVAQINRSLLPLQPSAGTLVTIDYQATNAQNVVTTGSVDLPVLVYSQSFSADAGYLYIYLTRTDQLDQSDPVALRSVGVAVADGSYRYTLNRVPSGSYVITAGSDLNKNAIAGDLPDAKGAYPFWGRMAVIEVGGNNISGLDFTSGYDLYLSASPKLSEQQIP
jgi:serine protease